MKTEYTSGIPRSYESINGTATLVRARRIPIFIILSALAGCTTWTHPSKTEQDYYRDQYECERDAAPQRDPMAAYYMQYRCMQVKGWKA